MAMSTWSQAPRKVHFFWLPIPAYAFLPFAVTLFHLRLWTIGLTVLVVAVLGYLSWKGRTVQWIARRAQLKLRMGGMHARPIWYRRRTQILQSLDVVRLPQLDHMMGVTPGVPQKPARSSRPQSAVAAPSFVAAAKAVAPAQLQLPTPTAPLAAEKPAPLRQLARSKVSR